jgi:predicted metal-dependent hydrolase
MTVDLLRQKRRTLSIVIDQHGKVTVKAPKLLSESKIWEFVQQKQKWIDKVLAKVETRKQETLNHTQTLKSTGKIVLFGELIDTTEVTEGNLKSFYKSKLQSYLLDKIPFYAAKMQIDLDQVKTSMKIREYKSKWGSCKTHKSSFSALGLVKFTKKVELTFNLKLAMFAANIIDYVVIHELAHIFEQNHSSKFWSHVQDHYPNYTEARKWLRLNSSKYSLEN